MDPVRAPLLDMVAFYELQELIQPGTGRGASSSRRKNAAPLSCNMFREAGFLLVVKQAREVF